MKRASLKVIEGGQPQKATADQITYTRVEGRLVVLHNGVECTPAEALQIAAQHAREFYGADDVPGGDNGESRLLRMLRPVMCGPGPALEEPGVHVLKYGHGPVLPAQDQDAEMEMIGTEQGGLFFNGMAGDEPPGVA